MSHSVIQRTELLEATLRLGGVPIELSPYATTGLRIVTVGPSGIGKTNAGMLIGESLSRQGWVTIMIDPEGELASLYGAPVRSPTALRKVLVGREKPIVVVSASNAEAFVPYGRVIFEVADVVRKPLFVMIDEGQLVSSGRQRKGYVGEATDLINQFASRGRKRALDLFVTTDRFTGSLHRSVFSSSAIKLIGSQTDPAAWAALSPQFKGSGIDFADLSALGPGEFFCISRRGIEKIRMPMAEALAKVARKASAPRRTLPKTFTEWDRAMRGIPTARLQALDDEVVALLSAVAGLPVQKVLSGQRAVLDELEAR